MVSELRRLSPVHKSSSRSPIAGLGLDMNSKYVPKKDAPKAVQKASPKVRHRRKSALKKLSTVGQTTDAGAEKASEQQSSVRWADDAPAEDEPQHHNEAPPMQRGGGGGEQVQQRAGTLGQRKAEGRSARPAHPSGSSLHDDDAPSELEFDFDGNERLMGSSQGEKEAYKRHIPLDPLKELEPLHRIIPLEEILQQNEMEEQMMVSTTEFNATVKLFRDREKKYQEAIQILEERNRTLQKIVVERDNVVAYLQAKVQSPTKRQHPGERGSYRELDLDGMDADEYPVLGMRSPSQMPNIAGLSSYIEKPSPSYSSYSRKSHAPPTSYGGSSYNSISSYNIGGGETAENTFSSTPSLVDTVYSSPFQQSGRVGLGLSDTRGNDSSAAEGVFSSRYASEFKKSAQSTPSPGPKKFERRLTKFDKSSIFSKYT
ncbi:hypothetical protein HOP50_19g84730 [Chloropicon primus]|uniref:Uncharacterized protein n=1 Tax=Chloropicon primus TaxID=1764295 RepID=A0A5B8N2M8_9CHLO|nr:hypothetical protein A3770_19p84420 [Chloropicon primus]UPR05125.1 hypothetical protein HOP50_19g84730 [Chloropicon primus]|eukprot:QDZ25924.1 hypothetical protein A3770_19p84420 [Chloropicon primus]